MTETKWSYGKVILWSMNVVILALVLNGLSVLIFQRPYLYCSMEERLNESGTIFQMIISTIGVAVFAGGLFVKGNSLFLWGVGIVAIAFVAPYLIYLLFTLGSPC